MFSSLNNKDLANDYLNESKLRLDTAESVVTKKAYAFTVCQSQEAVELSLKGALRLLGIDFPKWHDISEVLLKEKEKFPTEFQDVLPKLAIISSLLTKKREPAMYGDEENKSPPSKIFNKKDAEDALKEAKFCLNFVEELFKQINNEEK